MDLTLAHSQSAVNVAKTSKLDRVTAKARRLSAHFSPNNRSIEPVREAETIANDEGHGMINNLDNSDHNQQSNPEALTKIPQQSSEMQSENMFCGVCLFKLTAGVQSLEDFRNTSPLRQIWIQEELGRQKPHNKLPIWWQGWDRFDETFEELSDSTHSSSLYYRGGGFRNNRFDFFHYSAQRGCKTCERLCGFFMEVGDISASTVSTHMRAERFSTLLKPVRLHPYEVGIDIGEKMVEIITVGPRAGMYQRLLSSIFVDHASPSRPRSDKRFADSNRIYRQCRKYLSIKLTVAGLLGHPYCSLQFDH